MNSLRRFLDSISAMAVSFFVMGSAGILLGIMERTTIPIISYIGWGLQGVVLFIIIKDFLKLIEREECIIKNGVKHSKRDEEAVLKLGEFRTCVKANKVKIFLITFFHVLTLVNLVGLYAFMLVKKTGVLDMTAIVLMMLTVLLGLLPLRHLGDSVDFYANGFIYCGYVYLYQKVGDIFFAEDHCPRYLTGTLMLVNGDTLDGSYLKGAKRKYCETYFKRAIDPLEGK